MNAIDCENTGPLHGLRILDLTSVLMGPYCTMMFRQFGAEIIKVEDPDGDITRNLGPQKVPGQSGTYIYLNNGKKSISLDLRDPRGVNACLRIAAGCDVFLHSIRPQAITKLGLDYPALKAVNPAIIYCNLFGFGREGRYFGKPAYDDIIQAVSGLSMLQAAIHDQPSYVASALTDKITGMMAAYAITAAVYSRSQTGRGQEIDVPMYETMSSFLLAEQATGAVFDPPLGPPRYARLLTRHRRPLQTADGYLAVMVYNDKQWVRFCQLANREDLRLDTRFSTIGSRTQNSDAFYTLLSEVIATRSSEQWYADLTEAEIPCIRVNDLSELYSDPHLLDVGFFSTSEDRWCGNVKLPRAPVTMTRSSSSAIGHTPLLGENGGEVLREAGFEGAEIEALAKAGVLKITKVPPSEQAK
jgi:crotonobetainyl-CoA:carnitine CoA-transferase CaiB-like acyl-CoA transferase